MPLITIANGVSKATPIWKVEVQLLMEKRFCSLMKDDKDIPSFKELAFPINEAMDGTEIDVDNKGKSGRVEDEDSASDKIDSSS